MIGADLGGLVFEPLGESAWRLCDTRVAEHDASRLIAYVEYSDAGVYEAIWIGLGRLRSRHASREDILREALRLGRDEPVSRSSKPIPIPHTPPPR